MATKKDNQAQHTTNVAQHKNDKTKQQTRRKQDSHIGKDMKLSSSHHHSCDRGDSDFAKKCQVMVNDPTHAEAQQKRAHVIVATRRAPPMPQLRLHDHQPCLSTGEPDRQALQTEKLATPHRSRAIGFIKEFLGANVYKQTQVQIDIYSSTQPLASICPCLALFLKGTVQI